jgi:hypothetical protein
VLGLPYAGGDTKLSQRQLFQNLSGVGTAALDDERVIIGIDIGKKIDYVMGNQRLGLFYHGDADNYNEIEVLLRRYKKAIVVMDGGGEYIISREFAQRWPGRVFLCYFTAEKKSEEIAIWGEGDKFGQATVDRERGLQLCVDEFRTKKIPLQGTESDWYEYYLDWSALSRIDVIDPKTNQFKGIKWVRNGRDHRALATVLWRIGVAKFAENMAEIVMPGNDFASPGFMA